MRLYIRFFYSTHSLEKIFKTLGDMVYYTNIKFMDSNYMIQKNCSFGKIKFNLVSTYLYEIL